MYGKLINRVLLGLLMLVPGLFKLFKVGPTGVSGMLGGMGFPAPTFFAWVLILSEIVFGIAILANWKVEYTKWPPIIILAVAILATTPWSDFQKIQAPSLLLHLVAISGYWMLGCEHGDAKHHMAPHASGKRR